MGAMLDFNRIKTIANGLREQFEYPELYPVMIQTIISEEDDEFLYENRKSIYQMADSNEDCAILLAHMMVHLAFNEYDEEGFWIHFREFIGIQKDDRKKAFDPIIDVLEIYGFRTYPEEGRRQLVKSLLFNAGVPKVQANVFFNTIYNEFYKEYSGLISDRIDVIIEKIGKYYQKRDYSIIGFITVREFLSDSEYSGEMCKNVLRKLDQTINSPDDAFTIDLGLLEEPFIQWYSNGRLIRKKVGNAKRGLMLDSGDYDVYYIVPSMESNTPQYTVIVEPELSEDHRVTLMTIRTQEGLKTVGTKIHIGDYPILEGVRIRHENETLFELHQNRYLVFDKDGFLRKQLSPGNNIIIGSYELSDRSNIPISQILAEKDNYCVYRTFELSTNDVFELFGETITIGSNNENVSIEANRITNKISVNNKSVNAFYSHPRIVFNPDFTHATVDIHRNGKLIYNTSITDSPIVFDPNSIPALSIKNGLFKIRIRSGPKVFNYEYVCLNDFDVTFDDGSDLNGGSFSVTANGETKTFDYGKTDINITCPMRMAIGLYAEVEVKTPVLAFQYKPSEDIWCYPSSDNRIVSSDINRNFIVSCGLKSGDLCSLQFVSEGKKVIADEYAKSHNGICRFRIHHYSELADFNRKLELIYVDDTGKKYPLIVLNDISNVEVDDCIGGVCIFTLTNRARDCTVLLKAYIDKKLKTIPLENDSPEAVSYLYSLNYEILEVTGNDERLITSGSLSTTNSLFATSSYREDELVAAADKGDTVAEYIFAKKLIEKHQFKIGLSYLQKACEKGYEPAYLEMIYYYLFFNDGDNICEKNIAPYFDKLKDSGNRSISLFYDIEKINRPAISLFEDQDNRPE